MAQGQHVHDWHYGEPAKGVKNNQPMWFAPRYCKSCNKLEVVELNEEK